MEAADNTAIEAAEAGIVEVTVVNTDFTIEIEVIIFYLQ